jgi:hypothetical protein
MWMAVFTDMGAHRRLERQRVRADGHSRGPEACLKAKSRDRPAARPRWLSRQPMSATMRRLAARWRDSAAFPRSSRYLLAQDHAAPTNST